MGRKRKRSRGRSGGLISRRSVLGLLVLGGGGILGVQGTGAFSALGASRPFSIGTASDDAAFLGIDLHEPSGSDGDQVSVLTLTNNASVDLDSVSVSISPGSPNANIEDISVPDYISSGDSATVTATLSCDQPETRAPVKVDIAVSGGEQSVTATREIFVTCHPEGETAHITDVKWKGGNVNPVAAPETEEITVDVWYYDGNGQPSPGDDEFNVVCEIATATNKNTQADLPGTARPPVAVYVHEADESWHHPGFNPHTGEIEWWDKNADGVRWGAGSIESAFDVTCDSKDERPQADDVYDIRKEQWLDDREYIFEILHDDVWSADWDFDDGATESGHYLRHTYADDGNYEITLIAVIDGDEYTYYDTVDVSG